MQPCPNCGHTSWFHFCVESKNDLASTNIPHITNTGRKGGSPSAAAIINAIYKLAH